MESNIATIPAHAFNGCSALEEITIPEHIGDIKTSAFTGCTALKELTIHPRTAPLQFNPHENGKSVFTDSPIETIYLGGNVSYPSGHSPFSNLSSLRTVRVDDNVSDLPGGIFSECNNMDNIVLGEGIETIGDQAFKNCMSLRELELGASVNRIGANAFDGVNSLEILTSKAEEPPVCDTNALEGIDKFTCELHVPTPSVEKYKYAPQWEDFFTIKGDDDIATQVTEIDNLNGNIICLAGGLRAKGLTGKEVIATSLDGKNSSRHAVTTDDQFIALPYGCWIITVDGESQRILIK